MTEIDTVVVGAGQAGLAVSHELAGKGVEHVILERDRIGAAWANRWESFCLVTPNWSVQLPGYPYDGDDPDGFMPRDDIVAYLERYAASFDAPVREGVGVDAVSEDDGRFVVETSGGSYRARALVLATGAFQRPHRPAGANTLPNDIHQIGLESYRNPEALPTGDVLIVGSGQSGCQIAEELHEAGRRVVLACGRAPWGLRRIGGRDIVWWLLESGFMDAGVETMPREARLIANILASGHGGGHDMHLRTLHALGVTLTGRFLGAEGDRVRFAPDLAESVAWGDERYRQIKGVIESFAESRGTADAEMSDPQPMDISPPDELDLARFGTVLFAGGFRPDYSSWLPWPEAFDEGGFPIQTDGASTVVDGLYFVGQHFLRKRKSALLVGVGEDAAVVASTIAG